MGYKKVDYAIEATGNEAFLLWEKNHEKMKWEQNCQGYMPTVKQLKILGEGGKVESFPVSVSLTWWVIDGRTVLFYEPVLRAGEPLCGLGCRPGVRQGEPPEPWIHKDRWKERSHCLSCHPGTK